MSNNRKNVVLQLLQFVGQLCLLAGLWYVSNGLVQHFHLPIPPGVFGFFLLLILLLTRTLPVKIIQTGADFLLTEMLLFFIPIVVGVVRYKELFIHDGIKLLVAIVFGTLLVMAAVAMTVEFITKLKGK